MALSASQIPQAIATAAGQYGVDPSLALEVATVESNLNPNAVSSAGAIGIFQLMPATAASLGVSNPYDPQQNINGGVSYLASLISQFGDVSQALGAYNWGPGNVSNAVSSYGPDWLSYAPSETQNYVAKILNALGGSYSAALTPASVATGVATSASNLLATVGLPNPSDLASSLGIPAWGVWAILGGVGLLLLNMLLPSDDS